MGSKRRATVAVQTTSDVASCHWYLATAHSKQLASAPTKSNHNNKNDHHDPESFYLAPNVSSVADQLQATERANRCSTFAAADIRRALRRLARTGQASRVQSSGATNLLTQRSNASELSSNLSDFEKLKQRLGSAENWPRLRPRQSCKLQRDTLGCGTPALEHIAPSKESESALVFLASSITRRPARPRRRHRGLEEKQVAKLVGPISWSDSNLNSANNLQTTQQASREQRITTGHLGTMNNQQQQQQTLSATIESIQTLSLKLDRAASLGAFGAHLSQQQQQQLHQACSMSSGFEQRQADGGPTATLECAQQADKLPLPANKIGRLVGKKAARVKELLLQNLGRADRTTDELFELYEENFYKQQGQANKLAKEFKHYISALKSFQEASRSLNKCIQVATSDYQSARHDLVCENLTKLEQLNEALVEKLGEQVIQRVAEYLTQFVELKEKISKRRRKLIDFDGSRRVFELTLAQVRKRRSKQESQQGGDTAFGLNFFSHQQANQQQQQQQHQVSRSSESLAANQLVDEARLLKLREQFNYCKIMYETINGELHEELPLIYENKMKSLLVMLQNYIALEAQYHSNAAKLLATTSDALDEPPNSLRSCATLAGQFGGQSSSLSSSSSSSLRATKESAGQALATGAGGSSSGLGSSRTDSSSCPETCSSGVASGAGSPDSGARPQQRDEAIAAADNERQAEEAREVARAELSHEQQDAQLAAASSDMAAQGACVHGSVVVDGRKQVAPSGQLEQQDAELRVAAVLMPESAIESSACSAAPGSSAPTGNAETSERSNEAREDAANEHGAHETQQQANAQFNEERAMFDGGADEQRAAHSEQASEQASEQSEQAELLAKVNSQPALYKVKTNYKYLAEDVDELSFEADEVIQVLEFDDSQEPEEGWLLGCRELNGQRGLFPANFTIPI